MKKSIVLLITLFFISTISVLIIKNLDDSDKFIKEVNYDTTITQLFIATQNLKSEVSNYLIKNKDNLDEVLSNEIFSVPIPLSYANIEASVTVQKLNFDDTAISSDIRSLSHIRKDQNTTSYYEGLFLDNGIGNFYSFVEYLDNNYKKYGAIANSKQLESIIDTFIETTEDDSINKIKDQFYLMKITQNHILCKIDITISGIQAQSRFIVNTESKGINNFEFIIKK